MGRPTTKEGREERAKKRRGALRSSMDGSEEALLKGEMGEDEDGEREKVVAKVHYRAPGDEEEFFSPVRNAVVVSKGKSGGKKKSETMAAAMVVSGERKRVKWDKALVYEGPLEVRAESVDGILKVSLESKSSAIARRRLTPFLRIDSASLLIRSETRHRQLQVSPKLFLYKS